MQPTFRVMLSVLSKLNWMHDSHIKHHTEASWENMCISTILQKKTSGTIKLTNKCVYLTLGNASREYIRLNYTMIPECTYIFRAILHFVSPMYNKYVSMLDNSLLNKTKEKNKMGGGIRGRWDNMSHMSVVWDSIKCIIV